MEKTYDYLLFDLDGTLTYSHTGIYNCMRHALRALGKPEPTEAELRCCVGPPLEYSFREIFGCTQAEAEAGVKKYRERYSTVGLFENEPIEGAKECLAYLKKAGYKLALATSKPLVFARQIAEKFGFTPYLDVLAGCGVDGSLNTKAAVIEEALRLLGTNEREKCLMIGDRKHDAEGARACGVDFAALDVGYAEEGELENERPNYYLSSFAELEALFGNRESGKMRD